MDHKTETTTAYFYYNVSTGDKTYPIKTSLNPKQLDNRTATDILNSTYNTKIRPGDIYVMLIAEYNKMQALDESLTVKLHRDGYAYFIQPTLGNTVPVTLVRKDRDGDNPTYTDVLRVPYAVVERDCDGKATKELLAQIAEEFCKTEEGRIAYPDGMFWNDVVNIPDKFLNRYGVAIEPVDTFAIIEVDVNDRATGAD